MTPPNAFAACTCAVMTGGHRSPNPACPVHGPTLGDREAVERLAHQLRVALTVVDPGGYGTWRGNAQRALAEAERRGLVSAHTPTVVRTEGV